MILIFLSVRLYLVMSGTNKYAIVTENSQVRRQVLTLFSDGVKLSFEHTV